MDTSKRNDTRGTETVLLDGNQRATLAAVRALGRSGVSATAGDNVAPTLSGRSRYCERSFVYPPPSANSSGFLQAVGDVVRSHGRVVLFPMSDITMHEILRVRQSFPKSVAIPFASFGSYEAVSDKVTLFRFATSLGVPIPRTVYADDLHNKRSLLGSLSSVTYPMVLKPARSRFKTDLGWISAGVRYARDTDELKAHLDNEPFKSFPFLIQEKIEGSGLGIFLLMKDGQVIAQFAHRRLREKPPSGGVSVLCESIEPPPIALEAALKILRSLNWFGAAMIEFKEDRRDGIPKLMEVNARFWGSLQLAISSGVNFPLLLYRLALGMPVEQVLTYKIGVKSRWELGDLDHLLIRLKNRRSRFFLQPGSLSIPRLLSEFVLDFFRPSVRHEVFRWDDPGPFYFEMKQYLRSLWK